MAVAAVAAKLASGSRVLLGCIIDSSTLPILNSNFEVAAAGELPRLKKMYLAIFSPFPNTFVIR